jgi:divalent metal cation (Fe/Co/Zn/Cd) transporter
MVADGLHSLSEGASNIIGIVGISIASHPADKKHPYGFKKYETLFTLAIAGLLFFLAFTFLPTAFNGSFHAVSRGWILRVLWSCGNDSGEHFCDALRNKKRKD